MTFYTLTRPGGPWDYPTLGFVAVNGAVLDGAASTPAITSPPDAYWTVAGSAESGITRYTSPAGTPSPAEPADGAGLIYNATTNQYEASSVALSATYARLAATRTPAWVAYGDSIAKPTNPALVAIGDSITDNNHTATTWTGASLSRTSAYRGDGFLVRAMIALRQAASWYDVGISGETTAQMLARFDTDVTPLAPQVVVEAGGTNDVRSGLTAATIKANKLAMWNKAYAFGAKVVATTVPPASDSTTAQRNVMQDVNAWMREYARANPLAFALVDWQPDLIDPLTGGVVAAVMDTAGVHPNGLGCLNMASKFATAIGKFLPQTFDPLPSDNVNDLANLMPTPLLTGTTGGKAGNYTGTNATGWFGSTSATGAVGSKVARADGLGEWQQMACTGTGQSGANRNCTAGGANGWVIGDFVQATCEFETDAAGWTDGAVDIRLLCIAADGTTILHQASALSPGQDTNVLGRHVSGILRTPPIQVPASTVTLRCDLIKMNAGTVRFGRVAVRKLV